MTVLSRSRKLMIVIAISLAFFLAEISVGFYTGSLALVADAFHYLNDLVGFVVALVAFLAAERGNAPPEMTFGWQRATILGAFFNGVFLLALGVSIFLQSIERFVSVQPVENPLLVMIIGCVGFALNVVSAIILGHGMLPPSKTCISLDTDRRADHGDTHSHGEPNAAEPQTLPEVSRPHQEHRHALADDPSKGKPEHDLGIMGVLLHVAGDAANNIGVVIAGAIIWKTSSSGRYYADPAVSMAIAFMIFFSSIPIVKKSAIILLESAPPGVKAEDVGHDIMQVDGVLAVHELRIWRLNQGKALASAHIGIANTELSHFMSLAETINECFHAYGVHSVTLQPEVIPPNLTFASEGSAGPTETGAGLRERRVAADTCAIGCVAKSCEESVRSA
ncbi:hypothetical protein WHR41_09164 [Cladosporium halotolerans]|uniref:Uncharacterized protein n=1 Tax=Cladosporium halotolerans TaxID=1052096 RepID=A0AB34KB16_9PEZI